MEVRPNPFAPNGDGVRDSTVVTFTPRGAGAEVTASVSVVRVAGEVPLGVLFGPMDVSVDVPLSTTWSPGTIADGLYRFDVSISEGSETIVVPAFVFADSTRPTVTLGALLPNPFDPESDPPDNELRVPFTVGTNDSTTATTVSVFRGTVLVEELGIVEDGGTFELRWSGLAADSSVAPSGSYQVFAEARDLAGNLAAATRSFTLDRTAPTFVASDSLLTSTFPFTIRGLAVDDDRVVDVRVRLAGDSAFVAVDSLGAPADTVGYAIVFDAPPAEPGFVAFTLRATDDVGHTTLKTFHYGYDTVVPLVLSSTLVDGSGPYRERDVVRIRTVWNSDELTITPNFANLDSRWSPGSEDVLNEGGGSYLVTYELSRTNTRSSGLKAVFLRGSTGAIAISDTVQVSLAAATADVEFRVNRNRMDPLRNEITLIEAPEVNDTIEVEIYNLAGARIRTLEGTGQVVWDGRTEEGQVAATGTYALRMKTGTREDVRRIVVRRGG